MTEIQRFRAHVQELKFESLETQFESLQRTTYKVMYCMMSIVYTTNNIISLSTATHTMSFIKGVYIIYTGTSMRYHTYLVDGSEEGGGGAWNTGGGFLATGDCAITEHIMYKHNVIHVRLAGPVPCILKMSAIANSYEIRGYRLLHETAIYIRYAGLNMHTHLHIMMQTPA